jgi:mono/diheme cytochrome c family protein
LVLSALGLGVLSYWDDQRDQSVAEQLSKQHEVMVRQAAAPFEPEIVGAAVAPPPVPTDPAVAQGATLFASQACSACHGENGVGTAIAPALVGVSAKFQADQLTALLKNPTDQMRAGGMSPVSLADSDLSALIAYLETLK